jgi:hypothetical protein
MTYENMTPLAPDDRYMNYLLYSTNEDGTKKFNITKDQIVKAETGLVQAFRLGRPEMVNMVVIEIKGSDTVTLHEAQAGLVQRFKNSGTLLNLQYFERANRDLGEPSPQTV